MTKGEIKRAAFSDNIMTRYSGKLKTFYMKFVFDAIPGLIQKYSSICNSSGFSIVISK